MALDLQWLKNFISEGAQVVISGRNADKLNAAAEKLGNSNCKTVVADVCDVAHSKEFLEKVKNCWVAGLTV